MSVIQVQSSKGGAHGGLQSVETEMPMMTLKTAVREAEQDVYVEMAMEGQPLAHMFFDASDVDTVIRQLADCRSKLSDQVPTELDPGSRLEAVVDPTWRTEAFREDPRFVVLLLRHPGLGWTSFVLPPNEVSSLGRWLVDHGRSQSAEPSDP